MHLFGEGLAESARQTEYIPFGIFNILSEQGGLGIVGQPGLECFAHGFEHAERAVFVGAAIFGALFGQRFLGGQFRLGRAY